MKLSLSCFNSLLMEREKLFLRDVAPSSDGKRMMIDFCRDEKTQTRVNKRNGKLFMISNRTERSSSWNKNEDSWPRPKDFINFQHWVVRAGARGERKGNEREKRERNLLENTSEALRELRVCCRAGSDRSFGEIFTRRFAENGFECAHFLIVEREKIWDSPKMENYANLLSSLQLRLEGERGEGIVDKQEGNVAISKETQRIDTFLPSGSVTRWHS